MIPRISGLVLGFLGLSLSWATSGCASPPSPPHYDHLDTSQVSKDSERSKIEPHSFLLVDGTVASFTPKAVNDDDTLSEEEVVLQSDNPLVLQVLPGLDAGSFVLIAASVGQTSVRVLVGGELSETIPAAVVEQGNAGQ